MTRLAITAACLWRRVIERRGPARRAVVDQPSSSDRLGRLAYGYFVINTNPATPMSGSASQCLRQFVDRAPPHMEITGEGFGDRRESALRAWRKISRLSSRGGVQPGQVRGADRVQPQHQ